MDASRLELLSASDAARAIAEGAISSEQLVAACLARIRTVEPEVQAWQYLDPDHALAQARARDLDRREGRACGPLHGVPVGIKDIIDTVDMPTEDGTVLHAGRTPDRDATVVAMLRAAGAVILGKTVTTECAYFHPGKTRNPHHSGHTPGGSSSGSAAAVAAGMVPLALGSQTNGSVIRPAAFCGVYGFKPTHGLISRHGILKLSRTLDHVGVFARTLEDIALAAEQLVGHDERDPDTTPRARIPLVRTAAEEPPLPPLLAFVKTPVWDRAAAETRDAFAELTEALGAQCEVYELPESLRAAWDWHRTIMEAEMAANLEREWEKGRDRLSEPLRALLARGHEVKAVEYQKALARIAVLNQGFEELFSRYDAVLTPSAPGTAPEGLTATGDPAFCSLWTLCGMPALNLPLMRGENALPLGAQLVGARHDDARLLRTARWLVSQVQAD
ncbi:MAG: amidase [Betaproteobacteria bacterium]|nr:MAG: amidase [Betaproteobacteria bacterium]